jgi:hypothetical protein
VEGILRHADSLRERHYLVEDISISISISITIPSYAEFSEMQGEGEEGGLILTHEGKGIHGFAP